jgi:hypothetical protein
LIFRKKLEYEYDRSTVRLFGNVVQAAHGEAYDEVLVMAWVARNTSHLPCRGSR